MSGIWWHMSFVDAGTRQWLGGINTEADTLADALNWTHLVGLNPGGEVSVIGFRASKVDPDYVDRLITDPNEWKNQPPPENAKPLPNPLPPELVGQRR